MCLFPKKSFADVPALPSDREGTRTNKNYFRLGFSMKIRFSFNGSCKIHNLHGNQSPSCFCRRFKVWGGMRTTLETMGNGKSTSGRAMKIEKGFWLLYKVVTFKLCEKISDESRKIDGKVGGRLWWRLIKLESFQHWWKLLLGLERKGYRDNEMQVWLIRVSWKLQFLFNFDQSFVYIVFNFFMSFLKALITVSF